MKLSKLFYTQIVFGIITVIGCAMLNPVTIENAEANLWFCGSMLVFFGIISPAIVMLDKGDKE